VKEMPVPNIRTLTIISGIMFAIASSSAAGLTLVKEGLPTATIVIADQPSQSAREAATELQYYIEKMSGARLPIVSESNVRKIEPVEENGSRVYVGRSQFTDNIPGLEIPSGQTKKFREEGFVMWCKGSQLVLAGNDVGFYLGTRYAVCELLHRLGVRWFMPGDFGEIVPELKNITVDEMNVFEEPDFALRDYWSHQKPDSTMTEEKIEWKIHNKMTPRERGWFDYFGIPSDGSVVPLLPRDQFEEHPDWFALQADGTRDPKMACMTSPGMIDHMVKMIKKRASEGKRVSAFAPVDFAPRCFCERCAKMSTNFDGCGANSRNPLPEASTSNEWFYFVNTIMNEVNKEYPEHLIATNGYYNRDIPPELTDLNKTNNLIVMFANIFACTIHSYDKPDCWQMKRQGQMVKRWCELSDKVWIYNYNYTMLVGNGTLTPMVSRIRKNIPMLKEWGLFGMFDQDEADWSLTGIPTRYVRTKLMWDTEVDVDAVLDDFFDKWFGAASRAMRAYYDALENAFATTEVHGREDVILPEIYTPSLMKELEKRIGEAEQLAHGEAVKKHLRLERMMFGYLQHYVALQRAKQACDYREALRRTKLMLALREKMHEFNQYFGWQPYPLYGPEWRSERIQRLLGKTHGPEGRLVTVLPEKAKFQIDPFDDGRFERWQDASFDDADWKAFKTTTGWQNQGLRDDKGHPYKGIAWYRMDVDIPENAGDNVWLFCPAVLNEAWVWVNGKYAGHKQYQEPWTRPSEVDMDLSGLIEPGQSNQVAIRVLCNYDVFGANGIYERMFLYAKEPVEK